MSRSEGALTSPAYPFALLLPFALTAWFPSSLNAGVITCSGLATAGLLCLFAASPGSRVLGRSHVRVLAPVLAAAVWFALASSWAVNPAVSLFAPFGAAAGVLAAVWVFAGTKVADARSLRISLAAVAVAGSVFSVAALYEAFVRGSTRSQGYAAGFFENSTSAGEMFAVAILAAGVGALIARNTWSRAAFAGAGALSGGALVLSSSRTAGLGLALAFVYMLCVVKLPGGRRTIAALAATPPLVAMAGSAVAVLASYGRLGPGAAALVAGAGTDRDAIWRSAWAQLTGSPVIGKGLAQFSAIIDWQGLPTGNLSYNATADAHNIVLTAAVGGGVVGLALAGVAFTALLHELVRLARRRPGDWPLAALASVPVLVLGMGLVGWTSAATVLAASGLVGATLGSAASRETAPRATASLGQPARDARAARTIGALVGAAAITLSIAYLQPLSVEQRFLTSARAGATQLSSTEAEALYRRFRLPGIGVRALEALWPEVRSGSSTARQRAIELIALTERDATRDSPLGVRSLATAQMLTGTDPSGFELFERIVGDARQADPASGLWYAFAASEARRLGLAQQARDYAGRALVYPLDEPTRVWLTGMR